MTAGNLQLALCRFKLLLTFVLYPQFRSQKNRGGMPHSFRKWHFRLFFHLYCRLQLTHVHGLSLSLTWLICINSSESGSSVLFRKFKIFGFCGELVFRFNSVRFTCCIPLSPLINDSNAKDAILILQFMWLVFLLVVSVSGIVIES